ncbi:hypothetical protein K2X85_13555 [bacterium]|nr:hypothetical protein [bacterium]
MSTALRSLLIMGLVAAPTLVSAQIRIVNYNVASGPRAGSATILDAINTDTVQGINRPVDILLIQESTSVETTTQAFADLLNGLPTTPTQNYVRGNLNGGTTGGGRPSVIYNSNAVQLINETSFGNLGTSAQARQTLRYQFRPVAYGPEADFYVYNNHYKAGDTSTDRNRRNIEATALRANLDLLGEGTHAILVGDFNISSNLEAMWTTLRASGAGQVFDPLNREGIWGDSSSFKDIHTQSPTTTVRYSGQTPGGMDDRFDFQVSTGEVLDGEGFSYIPGTYRAFGNNGTHPLNGNIDDPSNTAEPLAVLQAIANSSDHLPVIADYQIPAKMSVAVGSVPSRVIEGASVSVPVTVENVAPVSVVVGADELDFAGGGTGGVTGSFVGTDPALDGGVTNFVTLSTASVGSLSGSVQVTSSSQAAANPTFNQGLQFDVLAHSNGSFSASTDVNSLTIDFGIVARNSIVPTRSFVISNLLSTNGITADLDLDQISSIGSVAAFNTNLSTFIGLDAGQFNSYTVGLTSSSLGIFDADYSLFVSDENLLGAINGTTLQLEFKGRVAIAGDANLDGNVTAADFAALQISFGGAGQWGNGDFNGDGLVTAADYALLQQNFGSGGSFAPSLVLPSLASELRFDAVPEVNTLGLVSLTTTIMAMGVWRRMRIHRSSTSLNA